MRYVTTRKVPITIIVFGHGSDIAAWGHPEVFSGKMAIEVRASGSLFGAHAMSEAMITVNPDQVSHVIYDTRQAWVEVPGSDHPEDWGNPEPASIEDVRLVGNHSRNHAHLTEDGCGVKVYQPTVEGSNWGTVYAIDPADV